MSSVDSPDPPLNAVPPETGYSRSCAWLLVAAVALGLAVRDSAGTLSTRALCWLTLALAAAYAPLFAGRPSAATPDSPRLNWLLRAAVGLQFAALLGDPFLRKLAAHDRLAFGLCCLLLATAAIACGVLLVARANDRRHRRFLPWLAAIQLAVGWLVLSRMPPPDIDVHVFQMHAARALLQGDNPYALTFPDPYAPEDSARFYGPGISVDGVLQFGYPYLPTTLLLALPGYLAGDTRYATLWAATLAALLIGYARPGRSSTLAAATLLFTPVFPLMTYAAWTDSFVLLLLALVGFCQSRARWLVPYAAGLLLASKQYMIVAAPLALLLVERPWTLRRVAGFGLRAVATGCAAVLPLALWDGRAFWHSAVALQFHQPFREDALSYLAWLRPAEPARWLLLPFVVVVGNWLLLWRFRQRISFAFATALVLAVFFAFNKQAFANYYYLMIGALCAAAAGDESREEPGICL